MSPKAMRIIGWILTALVGLFLIGPSGAGKFIEFEGKADLMGKLQIPLDLLPTLSVIEITVALLYLIPRTSFLGAILTPPTSAAPYEPTAESATYGFSQLSLASSCG